MAVARILWWLCLYSVPVGSVVPLFYIRRPGRREQSSVSGTPILTSYQPNKASVSCRAGSASEADSAQHGMARLYSLHAFTLQNKPCRDVRCRASPLYRVSVNTVIASSPVPHKRGHSIHCLHTRKKCVSMININYRSRVRVFVASSPGPTVF